MDLLRKLLLRSNVPVTVNYWLTRSSSQTAASAKYVIYSRAGDGGLTTVGDGEQLPKDEPVFDAMGTTDELSSYIGLAREFAMDGQHSYTDKLNRIQCILVDIGTAISKGIRGDRVSLSARHTKELEEWIDEYSKMLPPLEHHVIPGGGKACASLHVARSICRRAERCVIPLVRKGDVDTEALVYLNRLADFLLTISRLAAKYDQKSESIYIPRPTVEAQKEKSSS